MAAFSSIDVSVDLSKALESATRALVKRELLVGIPGDQSERPAAAGKPAVSNAVIAYIQETGDDQKGIPARPFLSPGCEAAKEAIVAGMKAAAGAVLDGNASGLDGGLTQAGLAAQASVKKTILDGNFTPLSERTLQARARRLQANGKLSQSATSKAARRELANRAAGEMHSTDAKPLYDSHSMFNAVTFVIRDKRAGD